MCVHVLPQHWYTCFKVHVCMCVRERERDTCVYIQFKVVKNLIIELKKEKKNGK